MESKLREDETVVRKLDEGWHVIRHGEKIEWLKTAYRRKLFRKLLLTNQRLVFLRDEDIDYEVSLENIIQAMSKRYLRLGTPYLRMELRNGSIMHIVFENIAQRVLDAFQVGAYGEDIRQASLTKEWASEINSQVRDIRVRQISESKTILPPPPPPPTITPTCPVCRQPLTFIQQYYRWYCSNCKKYP